MTSYEREAMAHAEKCGFTPCASGILLELLHFHEDGNVERLQRAVELLDIAELMNPPIPFFNAMSRGNVISSKFSMADMVINLRLPNRIAGALNDLERVHSLWCEESVHEMRHALYTLINGDV